jgi:succinate dehydrogenase hydrophobic anchor subunit
MSVTRMPAPARSARAWRWTVGSGLALVVLAAVHMVAQHFVVDQTGGLRTYRQVLDYLSNPIIFTLECGFLVAVTVHAMLGVRGVLLDLDPSPRAARRIDRALWVVGTATVAYGLVLLTTLASRA